MPFAKLVRKAGSKRPQAPAVTPGEHLRNARRERALTQKGAAAIMGVSESTVLHWQNDDTAPPMALWPAIIAFLGYDPVTVGTTLSDRMRAYRRHRWLSIKEAAARLGVDPSSWGAWERTGVVTWERYRVEILSLLSTS